MVLQLPTDVTDGICTLIGPSCLVRFATLSSAVLKFVITSNLFVRFSDEYLSVFTGSPNYDPNKLCEQKLSFRSPFKRNQIRRVNKPHSVAYLSLSVHLPKLKQMNNKSLGVYCEFHVHANPDSLSLSIVDFHGGGSSSLTFSPDTGVVILEKKSHKQNSVTGRFARVLPPCPSFASTANTRLSLFVASDLSVEFFRRCGTQWDCTGPVCDSSWVTGEQITPCIAFRECGPYKVTLRKYSVCHRPLVGNMKSDAPVWKSLDGSAHLAETN